MSSTTGPSGISVVATTRSFTFQLRILPHPPAFVGAFATLMVRVMATDSSTWLQQPVSNQQRDGSVLYTATITPNSDAAQLFAELGWVVGDVFLPIVNV